jgi:hypothetical protein
MKRYTGGRAIVKGTRIIDLDLRPTLTFSTPLLLEKVAKRVRDDDVMGFDDAKQPAK